MTGELSYVRWGCVEIGAWIQGRLGRDHNGDESVCFCVCMHVQSLWLRTQTLGLTALTPHPDSATS